MNVQRCRALIDLNAAKHNFLYLRGHTSPAIKLLCVVKADAYGHGAVPLARLWQTLGADLFAVATAEEAFALRQGGITTPCLVLGYASPCHAKFFCDAEILPTIYSLEQAKAWEQAVARHAPALPCHIKINTGMNRLGISATSIEELKQICLLPHLFPVGIYSHLSSADKSPKTTRKQLLQFKSIACIAEGFCERMLTRHIANTDALLQYPETHLDMVRAGIGLYGYAAGEGHPLMPVMQYEARVVQISNIKRGEHIGYGNIKAARDMHLATIAAGYADGIPRDAAGHHLSFTLHGIPCAVVGHVCMDMCMVDISNIKERVTAGDTAVFFGSRPACSAAEAATRCHTIPYTLLTAVSSRVPREYTQIP